MNNKNDFYVVGIGASAGGLDPVQKFFDNIPDNTGNAYIIIQHLSPDYKSLMPELLAKHTKMQIFTAEQDQKIKPNCVYLNQRKNNIGIENGKFILLDKVPKGNLNLPIDILFHMLGDYFKEKAIGVILSGTGSDGSIGIRTIKEAGGTILVQAPATAQFDGMPNSAIRTNLADFVLPITEMAEKIVLYTTTSLRLADKENDFTRHETTYQKILTEVEKFSGIKFSKYKNNTLLRRLEKRMNLHNFKSLDDYLNYLINNNNEKEAIKQEFLIGVTSFFRDKEAFEILRKTVVPLIGQSKNKQQIIRIWVAGCSTGEEVYSIAMLLEDYIRNNKLGIEYKIFATDVDKDGLRLASLGTYTLNTSSEIDIKFLENYFLKTGEKIQIIKRIREKIVFSYHDLTKDPPFIDVDLISCRNLLIYLNNSTQKAIFSKFKFALNQGGFLFLGSSESLGNYSSSFKVIDKKHKIFQNLTENKRLTTVHSSGNNFYNPAPVPATYHTPHQKKTRAPKQNEAYFYQYLCKKHAPVSIFIDDEYQIKFIKGDFRKWFSNIEGVFSNNLLNLVTPQLASVIRNGVRIVNKEQKPVRTKNMVIEVEGEKITTELNIENTDLGDTTSPIMLIQFESIIPKETGELLILSNEEVSSFSKQRIEELETELKERNEELQYTVEELETSNEELQSSNEELMSSNEELQSSNEELQSVNEELYTVNAELQEKNRELENLSNDISNLLNSTDIGTLFLDTGLNIRKFTPALKQIFNLEESDIGRSISSFTSGFDEKTSQSIISNTKLALEDIKVFEKEIKDKKGNWYLHRINPFVTTDRKIEGVVLTFVNINGLKKAESDLNKSENKLAKALEAGNMAWWEIRFPSGDVTFSKKKVEMIGRNPEDFKYNKDFLALVHPDDHENIMMSMQKHLEGKAENYECEYRIKTITGEYKWFKDIGKIVYKHSKHLIVSGIVIDITKAKRAKAALTEAKKKAETANIYKDQFLANMSHEIRTPMSGLVGFASLLREDKLDATARNEYIDIIENSADQLLKLINDIIDISKIEAGELNISYDTCNVHALLQDLEVFFNNLKLKKGKEKVNIVANLPQTTKALKINTDPLRLRQVLVNLIGNALKFTQNGKVEFGYEVHNNKIKFIVKGTGIGIPIDQIKLIFERFQQIEQRNKTRYGGTGLGLTISNGIVGALGGGSIHVYSEVGKGSVFSFEIPFNEAETSTVSVNSKTITGKSSFNGQKILIAEDNEINIIYLKEVLSNLDLELLWARDGKEAVDLFNQHDDIQLVLMDIRMTVMDGSEAAKIILDKKPNVRIIAQTAYAMAGDEEKFINAGFKDYIAKPLKKEKLIELIEKWIE